MISWACRASTQLQAIIVITKRGAKKVHSSILLGSAPPPISDLCRMCRQAQDEEACDEDKRLAWFLLSTTRYTMII